MTPFSEGWAEWGGLGRGSGGSSFSRLLEVFHPVGLADDGDEVGMVDEAIEHGARDDGTREHLAPGLEGDCAPKFDPVNGSIDATLAGVEALRFEISERGLVAYA